MTLTRRELAAAAVAAMAAPSAESQTQQPAADLAKTDLAKTDMAKVVYDANQRNSEALAKFEIPIATEPAFQFKA
jgi:hypothetical protein